MTDHSSSPAPLLDSPRPWRRVVVTGMGWISPIGNTWADVKTSLETNTSGVVRMTDWESIEDLNTRVAAPARPFELDPV